MNSILVTGGAGFIGSHFVDLLIKAGERNVVVFDKLTYAGKKSNMSSFINDSNVTFINGDIANLDNLKTLFNTLDFSIIYNFAAESHVDNSINSPAIFIESNVVGTHNLLYMAKCQWEKFPNWKESFKFIQISTDEVYGMLGSDGSFSEEMPLSPSSPYSASKASADLLCISYFKTYGFPMIITRSSNNFGPRQDVEKLIPKAIIHALNKKKIPIYGNGLNVRDWIYVEDNCSAIFSLSKVGKIGDVYNIGGNNEMNNLEIVKLILEKTNTSNFNLIEFVTDRIGHDFRYSVNTNKSKHLIGNFVETEFNLALDITINFYKTLKI